MQKDGATRICCGKNVVAKDSVTKYAFEKDAVEIDGDGKESIATKYAIALKGQ